MPILHCDTLRQPTWTMYIGLIKDEANLAALHTGSRIDVPSLGENLTDTVEIGQGADHSAPEHGDPTLNSSSHEASRALSLSRFTSLFATLVRPS